MKKINTILLWVAAAMFVTINMNAQEVEFPWPDLGEGKIIEPGAPGTINDAINFDTTATGERAGNYYILKRGATYLYTARIGNSGWPLMVVAEDGDGPLPIIKALGPAEGEDEAERAFHAEGDLYIKDLVISGWDQGGNFTDNATVRLAADSITVVCKDIVFDFNRQNNFRVNAIGCKIYIEDCIVANQGYGGRFNQGFFFNTRGNFFPIAHIRNNTIYNMQNSVIEHQGNTPREYQKLIFENNTVMNTGASGMRFGRPDTVIFKNNLIVNMGILGDAVYGDRDRFVEGYYFVDIDSVFTDSTNTELVDPVIEWTNNHFYFDPELVTLLPDSANSALETMFHPYIADLIGEDNLNLMEEKFEFTNFPATVAEYQAAIDDFYNQTEVRADLPLFDTPYGDLDFSYDAGAAAYSAATDGGPLGDRNWFPDWVPESVQELKELGISIFPNPAGEVIFIQLDQGLAVDRVAIANVLGQEVRQAENLTGSVLTVNTSGLSSGIYFVNLYENDRYLGTAKMLKK